MKQLLAVGLILGLTSCGWSQNLQPDSAAPVAMTVKNPLQGYQPLSLEEASRLGLGAYSLDSGDSEYGLYLLLDKQLQSAIRDDTVSLHVSIWNEGRFVASVPGFRHSNSPFLLQEGYQLQILINPQSGFMGLQPGTGYYLLLEPKEYLRAL